MEELSNIVNIGPVVAKQLSNVGINTLEELVNVGSIGAWLMIKASDPSACINRLLALEGAIQGIRWHNLSADDKKYLKDFYERNKY